MSPPICRSVRVTTFRGDRTRAFAATFLAALAAEKAGTGPGPTQTDCLIFAGHTGVSLDAGATVYGFNPDGSAVAVWKLLDDLKAGDAYPGLVRDDTAVFAGARARGLAVLTFNVILPDPVFADFEARLDGERAASKYKYGFPNGDGDCNCTTWLERLGLPLLTGRMNEFTALPGISAYSTRRFGECI